MKTPVDWEVHYRQYKNAMSGNRKLRDAWFTREITQHLHRPLQDDLDWLTKALKDSRKKWFVAAIAARTEQLADSLFLPLMRAAIEEVNPSANRAFVEPCIRAYGTRRVNEHLLDVLETGEPFEQAGAVNALYWANVRLTFIGSVPEFTLEHATPESRAEYEAMYDILHRKRMLYLECFVSSKDVNVQRSLIAGLNLDPDAYPDSHKPLVDKAINLARSHEDEYIRHRVEVQLGTERMLKPLPHRKTETRDSDQHDED
ncbi:MAG: hypothetical protein ACFFC7_14835 [Candidatus Hermodarchaeota archaeon]